MLVALRCFFAGFFPLLNGDDFLTPLQASSPEARDALSLATPGCALRPGDAMRNDGKTTVIQVLA